MPSESLQNNVQPSFPALPRDTHKHRRGTLVIVGGSEGLGGAVRLAGAGALRGGCGLVRVGVPQSLRAECASDASLMVQGLPGTLAGGFAFRALNELTAWINTAEACVLGPGLGRQEETVAMVRALVPRLHRPLVIDADALNALSPLGMTRPPHAVWTPHAAEAARLLGVSAEAVEADRPGAARALVQRCGGVVILKGQATLIADAQRTRVNRTGNPGLARGGSGDILAGLIGALLAGGMPPFEAAAAAVWLHGTAAERAALRCGERGMQLQALLDELPGILRECEQQSD